MGMDPRTLRTMLQSQLAPSLSFGSTARKDEKNSDGASSVFNTILSAQLSSANDSSASIGSASNSPDAAGIEEMMALDSSGQPVWTGDGGLWGRVNAESASYYPIWTSLLSDVEHRSGYEAADLQQLGGNAAAYAGLIETASAKYGVSSSLIAAVIATESGFDAQAESHAGAKGLMQLMDGTARGLGVQDSFDPVQNVDGGTKYLSLLLRKYNGNELTALAAYNAGPGRMDRLGIYSDEELLSRMEELPQETQRYVVKVQQAKA